jgi:hypothetical protein
MDTIVKLDEMMKRMKVMITDLEKVKSLRSNNSFISQAIVSLEGAIRKGPGYPSNQSDYLCDWLDYQNIYQHLLAQAVLEKR